VAEDFLEAAEEEDFEADGLGDSGHGGIVTRAAGRGQRRGWSVRLRDKSGPRRKAGPTTAG
jgi:hypothetical protein